jgi:hypothetical protein
VSAPRQEIRVRSSTLFVFIVSIIGIASPLSAQATGQLQVGARVRLVPVDGRSRTGVLATLSNDSISLVDGRGSGAAPSVALNRLSKVQISAGKRRLRGAMIGGALGFVVGAVAGGIAGGAIYHDAQKKCDDPLCEIFTTPRIGTAAGAYGGGALGLVTGAIVGSLVKNERWVDAEGLGSRK